MKNRLVKVPIVLVAFFLFNSCATMFNGTTQKVHFNSNPSGADLYINGVASNSQTPCEVTIKRKVVATEHNKNNQYNYVLKKNGYEDYLISDNAKFNYVSLLNLYWIGIPYIIDIPTGAIWKYEKNNTANLAPSNAIAKNTDVNFRASENAPPKAAPAPAVNNKTINNVGKYYALIIGNNVYQDQNIHALDEPIKDATKLYNVLTTKYTFLSQNVTFLKNASYEQMIQAFDDLSNKITKDDNLLVFYAGHGWFNETQNLGYWLPTDAKKSNTAFWIPNSRISDYMNSIKSKHTLLIADACFSGSIFKTRSAFSDAQPSINKLYEMPSKKAMTSGTLKEVPDKSIFLQFLVQRLSENKEKYLSSDILFTSFRQAVLNNSPTEPQYGTIQNAGDEGGEFIFILK